MSHYGRNTMGRGTPKELAAWAHMTLERRKCGKSFALVLANRDAVELVDAQTRKLDMIETTRGSDIVGFYTGYHKRKARITVEDLEADIRMTLEGV